MLRTLFFTLCLFFTRLHAEELVLVSIAPYETMCEDLTGKAIAVELLVPAGYSLHTYEPTPKQILRAAKAKIWFVVGEIFEKKVIKALREENPKLVVSDLREGLHLIDDDHDHDDHEHHHHEGEKDPHIWMSPKMMQIQVSHMAHALIQQFPELKEIIEENKNSLLQKLVALDQEIRQILKDSVGKTVFVSHPAYGYFCNEYGLKQVSVEFEGKDPTPRQLNQLLVQAKNDHISHIFTQRQYSTKASDLLAHELNIKVVMLDPYSKNYFESMQEIAKNFAEAK